MSKWIGKMKIKNYVIQEKLNAIMNCNNMLIREKKRYFIFIVYLLKIVINLNSWEGYHSYLN